MYGRQRVVLSCIAALTAIASLAAAQRPAPPRIRDSSGVQIVEHATIKNLPVIALVSPTPQFELGGLKSDPLEEFDSRNPFMQALKLSNGRLVATDYSSFKILEPTGKVVKIVGRSGQGPGEFGQLRTICVVRGDTIIAFNYGGGRASIFDGNGNYVRDFTFGGLCEREEWRMAVPAHTQQRFRRIQSLKWIKPGASGFRTATLPQRRETGQFLMLPAHFWDV